MTDFAHPDWPLAYTRGDLVTVEIPVENDDGSGYDLTGCTIIGQIRRDGAAPTAIDATITTVDDLDGVASIIHLTFADTDTTDQRTGRYVWQVEIDPGSGPSTIAGGTTYVGDDIAHA